MNFCYSSYILIMFRSKLKLFKAKSMDWLSCETWVSVEWSLHRQKIRGRRSRRWGVRSRPTLRNTTLFVCNDWSALLSNWGLIVGHIDRWVTSGLSRRFQWLVYRIYRSSFGLLWSNRKQSLRTNNEQGFSQTSSICERSASALYRPLLLASKPLESLEWQLIGWWFGTDLV